MAKVTKSITKAEMIDALAQATGSTKIAVEEVYSAMLTLIAKETQKGPFTLPGIGKFAIVQRKARKGRNPFTKEEIKIPAKKAVKFTVSKLIKDKILETK